MQLILYYWLRKYCATGHDWRNERNWKMLWNGNETEKKFCYENLKAIISNIDYDKTNTNREG